MPSPHIRGVLATCLTVLTVACDGSDAVAPTDAPAPPAAASAAHAISLAESIAVRQDTTDAPVTDALIRVAPALGARGEALSVLLARLRSTNGSARTFAARNVENALDALERSAPADLQPDLAALRLNLEAMTAATDHTLR